MECIAGQRTILRLENDWIANRLQWMWKEMQEDAQFENQKMIEWQVDCNECGNRCKKTHNLKIHKWSEDKPIAMNVERDVGQCTIWKFTNYRMTSQLQWFWKRCRKTQNLKIHKWSEGKSIAMNEDRGAGRHTILQSEMVGWQVDCNVCGKRCRRTHNFKIHKWSDVKSIAINVEWIAGQRTILRLENDGIASRLQSMWKEMQEGAQFENSQMIGCQVDCIQCGKRYRTMHNFKIRKW